jgi:hypothetical protein
MRPKSRKHLKRERDTRFRRAMIRGDDKAAFAYMGKPKPPIGTVAPCHPLTLVAHTRGPEWVDSLSDAEAIALYHITFGCLPPGLEGLAA